MSTYLGEVTGAFPREHLCKARRRSAKHQVTNVARYVVARQATVAKKLRGVFDEWAARFAKRARRVYGEASKAVDAELVERILRQLDLKGFSVDLIEELTSDLKRAFRRAGIAAIAQAGFARTEDALEHLDKKALEYAEKRAAELVGRGKDEKWNITETTRDRLRETIAGAVEEGVSSQELADRIEGSFPFSEGRANTIARTELAFAHVQGNVEGWRSTGEVAKKRWVLGDLHDVPDICDELADAGEVDFDEDFGDGIDFPPAHPNCVCDVIPILKDKDED